MIKKKQRFLIILLTFSLCIFIGIKSAGATATLKVSDGTNTIICADGDGCDSSAASGAVVYTGFGLFGGVWDLSISTGITYDYAGSLHWPVMTLDNVSASSNSSGSSTLYVSFSQDGFQALNAPGFNTVVSSTTVGGTVSYAGYIDDVTNTLFTEGTTIGSLGPYSTPHSSAADTTFISPSTPYSLTSKITITHGAGNLISQPDMAIYAAPEPLSSTLFLVGAATLGYRRFRKRA